MGLTRARATVADAVRSALLTIRYRMSSKAFQQSSGTLSSMPLQIKNDYCEAASMASTCGSFSGASYKSFVALWSSGGISGAAY